MHDYGRDRCMRNCAWRWRTLSAGCRLRTGLEHWEWRRSSQGGDQCRHDAPLYCTGMTMVAPPPTWRRAKLSVFECHAHCMYVAAAKHRGHRTGGGGREVWVGHSPQGLNGAAGARVRGSEQPPPVRWQRMQHLPARVRARACLACAAAHVRCVCRPRRPPA